MDPQGRAVVRIRDGLHIFFGWEQIYRKPPAGTNPFVAPPPYRDDLVDEVHLFGATADEANGLSVSHQALCGFEKPGNPRTGHSSLSSREQPFGPDALCRECRRRAEEEWGAEAIEAG